MALVNKFGLMVHNISVIGLLIKRMVKANLYITMEKFMKEIGQMIKLMEEVNIDMQVEAFMMENGTMIFKMVLA